MKFSQRDINLLIEALTCAASRHDSQARAGHSPAKHQRCASDMRELGSRLLNIKVIGGKRAK